MRGKVIVSATSRPRGSFGAAGKCVASGPKPTLPTKVVDRQDGEAALTPTGERPGVIPGIDLARAVVEIFEMLAVFADGPWIPQDIGEERRLPELWPSLDFQIEVLPRPPPALPNPRRCSSGRRCSCRASERRVCDWKWLPEMCMTRSSSGNVRAAPRKTGRTSGGARSRPPAR